MDKNLLLDKITSPSYKYDASQLKSWVKSLPASSGIKPKTLKKGDIFMHPIFHHPYVFIEKKDNYWLCTLLTSNGEFEEVLEKCKSRFFTESYLTKTLFTITNPVGSFIGVYDNNRHLGEVLIKLKETLK